MTSPGAIGDGNDLCILHIVLHPSPPYLHHPSLKYLPPVPPQNLSDVCKIRLGISGNPLHALDMHQIEVGFLYLLCVWVGGGSSRGNSRAYINPLSLQEDTPIH